MAFFITLLAALTIATGQDIMQYHKCKDLNNPDTSYYGLRCDAGKVIIVDSAIVGATDKFNPPDQCPITNNTCLKEITIAADLCTWRNSCDISQNSQRTTELQLPCSLNGNTVANFINISYSCILPVASNFGDICHFEGNIFSGTPIYVSSYPNFPNSMGNLSNYKCSCQLTSKPLSGPVNVTIRALLVKLEGAAICSERLSVVDSEGKDKVTFCSPCNNTKNVTAVPLMSNPVISFQRDADINPFNGKFILEIAVQNLPSATGSIGSMKCGFVSSTISSSAVIPKASSSYISTKTTSVILGNSNGFGGSTNDERTSSGMTVRSSTMAQKGILSSSNPASISQNDTLSASMTTPTHPQIGVIVGIVVGVVGFLAVLSLLVLFAIRNVRSKRNAGKSTEPMVTVTEPHFTESSIDENPFNPGYEITTPNNSTPVNQPKILQSANMIENQDTKEHSYYNGGFSNIISLSDNKIQYDQVIINGDSCPNSRPLSDNQNQYELLRKDNGQQQTYYNQPSEVNTYQSLISNSVG